MNGAEPGDVLEIRILRIEPKPFAVNFNLPGKEFPTIGALASEMPEGFLRFFTLDLQRRTAEFKPGITLDLQPFPGTLAVGIDPNDPSPRKGGAKDPMAPVSTLRPWKNGSNMDINEMQEGSTVFIPVFLKGGLIWTGDSHCRQGNGEVNLTALECSFKEIRLQPIVRKDMKLEWPFIETRTHWITHRLQRGSQRGNDERHARGGQLARQPEVGADGSLRGLQPGVDGRGLPRVAGGRCPQGRALHDPEVDLRKALLVAPRPHPLPCDEERLPSAGLAGADRRAGAARRPRAAEAARRRDLA